MRIRTSDLTLAWLLAAACADVSPSQPDADADVDARPDSGRVVEQDDPDAAAATPAPDADPPAPDAGPGDEMTRTFGASFFTDTYIHLGDPSFNYGASGSLCADTTVDDRRILLRVDVSTIAAGVEVTGAELHLWTGIQATSASNQIFTLYPMLERWREGSKTGTQGDASWNERTAATAWTTRGAGVGSRGANAVGSFVPDATDTEFTVALDTALVQAWVDDPASNHGVTILSAAGDEACFASSERADAARRPSLVVRFR